MLSLMFSMTGDQGTKLHYGASYANDTIARWDAQNRVAAPLSYPQALASAVPFVDASTHVQHIMVPFVCRVGTRGPPA